MLVDCDRRDNFERLNIWRSALAITAFLVFVGPTHTAAAQSPVSAVSVCQTKEPLAPSREKRVAIVFGNNTYSDKIGALRNPINDASAVSSVLGKLGFKVFLALNATEAAIRSCATAFLSAADSADIGLLYYSGHGIQIRDENYLVGVDMTKLDPSLKGFVAVQPIVDEMQKRAKASLVFLDACRNNPFAETGRPGLSVSTGRNLERAGGPVAPAAKDRITSQERGLLVAYATSPNALALDGSGDLSPFTEGFVKAIASPGASIQRVMSDVTRSVGDATLWAQTPWTKSSLTREVMLNGSFSRDDVRKASELWARRSNELLESGDRDGAVAAALKGVPRGMGDNVPAEYAAASAALATAYFTSRFKLPDTDGILSASISDDRQLAVVRRFRPLATGGIERIELWSVPSQSLVAVLDEMRIPQTISGISLISGDGRFVASHIIGGRIKVWSTSTRMQVAEFRYSTDFVRVRFTPRSNYLIVGTNIAWSTETMSTYFDLGSKSATQLLSQAKIAGSRQYYLDVDDEGNICVHSSNSANATDRSVSLAFKMKSASAFQVVDRFLGEIEGTFSCGASRGLILNSYASMKRRDMVLRIANTTGQPARVFYFPLSNWSGSELYFDADSGQIATFDGSGITYQVGSSGQETRPTVGGVPYMPRTPGLYDKRGSRSETYIRFSRAELWPNDIDVESLAQKAYDALPLELRTIVDSERVQMIVAID